MRERETIGDLLARRGISRRALLKYATYLASTMALPPTASRAMAEALAGARRQSVIWLSFQECTGCTESLTRSFSPTIEEMIFDLISLDYHETLQAVSGAAAEEARLAAMKENEGKYVVIVDGSVSTKDGGVYSTSAGKTNLEVLKETAEHAFALISVGTCAAFGGIPHAKPNPTGAVPVTDIITDKPVINISGCPPIAEAMAGTIAYLDHLQQAAGARSPEPAEGLLRRQHPRPLLPPAVLRQGPVRQELRRRGRAQGLVPLRGRLQGPGHLQRLRHAEMERRRVLPDPVGAWLPRLLGAEFLGQGRFLQAAFHQHRRTMPRSSAAQRRQARPSARQAHCWRAGARTQAMKEASS